MGDPQFMGRYGGFLSHSCFNTKSWSSLDELGVPPWIGNPECTASQTPVEVGAKGSRYVLKKKIWMKDR